MLTGFYSQKWLSKILTISLILINISLIIGQDATSETLSVKIIEDNGFGCRSNLYSWSMESFKGKLYIGTLNIRGKGLGMNLFFWALPVFSSGAQVHRGTRASDGTWTWERVLRGGLVDRQNYGIRKLVTVEEYLYGVTGNHVGGFDLFQTFDGMEWKSVITPGFGNKDNTSGRGLVSFREYLYVGVENRVDGAEIWRHKINLDGSLSDDIDWEQVDNGLDISVDGPDGPIQNDWFSDFVAFNDGTTDYIYAGTLNREGGAQLWRTTDGISWENIFRGGNGDINDSGIMKLFEFQDRLYLGTMNFDNGSSLLVSTDSTGTNFTSLFNGGNGNPGNVYVWNMIEFSGRLYVGTFHGFGRQEFDLFSSADPEGEGFILETDNAFGIANNIYGTRSMAIHDGKLIIGGASNNKPTMIFEATYIGV